MGYSHRLDGEQGSNGETWIELDQRRGRGGATTTGSTKMLLAQKTRELGDRGTAGSRTRGQRTTNALGVKGHHNLLESWSAERTSMMEELM